METYEILPDHYTLADILSRGSFYVNQRCIDLRDGEEYTAKIIDLQQSVSHNLTLQDIEDDIEICRTLSHPHLAEIYEFVKVNDSYFFITELITGYDLLQEILIKASAGFMYSEAVASHYIRQLMEGICYMHNQNILHRDIKLEGLMLSSTEDAAPLKITDLEKATEMPDCDYLRDNYMVGTRNYMSPEMLQERQYGFVTDIWSCGIILYVLIGGSFPFDNNDDVAIRDDNHFKIKLPCKALESISTPAKDLLANMLRVNKEVRYTAQQVLQHSWLKERDTDRVHLSDAISGLQTLNVRRNRSSSLRSRKISTASQQFEHEIPKVSSQASFHDGIQYIADLKTIDGLDDIVDQMKTKTHLNDEDLTFVECLLQNNKLKALLKIHSLTQQTCKDYVIKDLKATACEALYEVNVLLNSLAYSDNSFVQLKDILQNPHIMALLHTHDDVIKEIRNENVSSTSKNKTITTDDIPENLTRVRLVQFPRHNDEPLGVTLKLNNSKHCVVARIIHGGMIHRQGTLQVGDELREINGIDVTNISLENMQLILKEARGDLTFKIIPAATRTTGEKKEKQFYVRCLYDYDPYCDDFIPCQQAGLSFTCGDILEIVSRNDLNWWQAASRNGDGSTGLIPSPELQELRIANLTSDKETSKTSTCLFPKKSKKIKSRGSKYSARLNTTFDQLALLTYEEVTKREKFSRKTLVLLGAHGVGRRHIKNSLISKFSEKFAYPLPHTSRRPSSNETHGESWYFESEAKMLAQISRHEFLEYGQHEGSLYGTKLSTIRDIVTGGKIPVLDPETPTLKILRCKEFSPYIVFISSPTSFSHTGDPKMDTSLQRLITESNELKTRYKHYFDHVIINNSIEDTVDELLRHLQSIEEAAEWSPTSWMY